MRQIFVHKGRLTVVPVSLGIDVSQDTFKSEIREFPHPESDLLLTWIITFLTDGSDGELLLTMPADDSVGIDVVTGYMDVKRTTGGVPVKLFDDVIEVVFRDSVTI